MNRERKPLKQKLESAKHFVFEATDAIEDLLEVVDLLKIGRDPKSIVIPASVTRRSGTREENFVVGYTASYWDLCAYRCKQARRRLGILQSACRQMARDGLKREGKR